MNVLSLLESDFGTIIEKMVAGTLSPADARFAAKATVCKYLVPDGYPDTPQAGREVRVGDYGKAILYYANIEEREGKLYSLTSRTLAFVGIGDTLDEAENEAEKAASTVQGSVWHRRDIGTREMLEKKVTRMKELR
jgi:phosphoribosylamine--glycine ligase